MIADDRRRFGIACYGFTRHTDPPTLGVTFALGLKQLKSIYPQIEATIEEG